MIQDEPVNTNHFPPIAIVGMGALFAGSRDLTEFWENILNKRDCIQEVPAEYWDTEAFYDADPACPDKTYCKRGGFLPEIEFDAFAFGIPPKALEAISLNQLLSLKVAGDALLDARMIGKDAIAYDKEKVGVIVAANIGGNAFPLRERLTGIEHLKRILNVSNLPTEKADEIIHRMQAGYIEWNGDSFPGFLPNIVAGRIANRFDFGGINYTVDGACAGSLCAIRQAMYELHGFHCDIILAGGVNVSNDPLAYLSFSKTPALSLKNQIRPYDKNADGMLVGDGIGMVVLKRLEDAEKAGDRIYAVIRGVGASSDGRAKSIYAPRPKGQINAIKRAYESSGISPQQIGLIEGHGTGTVVGDACEIKALKAVFAPYGLEPQSIALGSVKSQIGHTTQAAGAASTIKTALALYHQVLPPMISFEEPNPDFELDKSPFYITSQARPWISTAANQISDRRMAAVSAFGFGGVNLHMLLEEYHQPTRRFHRINRLPHMILIDGLSSADLRAACQSLLAVLSNESFSNPCAFDEIMAPYCNRRIQSHLPRLGFICSEPKEAAAKLETALTVLQKTPDQEWNHPAGIFHRLKGVDKEAKIVALFPGQGSQYPLMGNEIALNYPELREAFEMMDMILKAADANPVSDMIFQKPVSAIQADPEVPRPVDQTQHAQPILAAFTSGLYNILKNIGFQPDICVGHSFGELVALWAGGALTTKDLYILSLIRGQFMQTALGPDDDPGTMLAVNHPMELLKPIMDGFKQVGVANYNAPDQTVLSGSTESIARIGKKLSEMGIKNKVLPVSGAFHSDYMQTAARLFKDEMAHVPFSELSIPVYSNRYAKPYPPRAETFPEILSEHLLHPVLFQASIEAVYQEGGRIFVEIGPRRILSDLVKRILKGKPIDIVSVNPGSQKESVRQLWEAITQLRVIGLELNEDMYQPERRRTDTRQKQSLKVVLKGRQYISPETLKKMETAVGKNTPPVKTGKHDPMNKQTDPEHEAARGAGQVQKGVQVFSNDLDQIIRNHMANSQLQQQFLLNQAQQLALMDKLIDQQGEVIGKAEDSQAIQALHANYHSNLEHLYRVNELFYHAHLTYLNQQHSILTKMTGSTCQDHPAAPASGCFALKGLPAESAAEESAPSFLEDEHSSPSAQQSDFQDKPTPEKITGATPHISEQAFKDLLLKLVSNQTGYPQDMLDLDMDIEADLGIDSIKRLEIFSGLHEAFPQKQADIELSELGELKTLQAVIDFFRQHVSLPLTDHNEMSCPPEPGIKSEVTAEAFAGALLKIVSEHTGYPQDMLDLEMDIEADLGIDSIKRLEIFSCLHELFPNPSAEIELSELGELKTLQAVITFFRQNISAQDEKKETISTRYIVETVPLDLPEITDLHVSPTHQILIINGDDETATQIKQALSEKGYKATMLKFSEFGPFSPDEADVKISMHSLADESIKRLLDTIAEKNGPIGGVIHINPRLAEHATLNDFFNADESKLLKTVFFITKHLKQPLMSSLRNGKPFFFTVTQMDGKLGLNCMPSRSILQGGYAGLIKSLKKEAPHIFCRNIDIDPHASPADMCAIILEELCDADTRHTEIGRTSQIERCTIGKKESRRGANQPDASAPDRDTVFLVSGGGRGVTARCVEGLARSYHSNFIILGRTAIDAEEPEWAKHIKEEQDLRQAIIENLKHRNKKPTPQQVTKKMKSILHRRDILQTLDNISAAGAKAVYLDADITDTATVKKKLGRALERFGPITGVIHGAGNLADKLLEKKEETDYDLVFQTKVQGLKTIMACVDASQIQYMILFSSISGFLGQIGQADYSLANEILNKFAHALSKRYPDMVIRSVNWGPWDGGMVGPELKRIYQQLNIDVIPIAEGVKCLVDELACKDNSNTQIIICPHSLYELDAEMKAGKLDVEKIGRLLN